jgi:hypothetical protein
MTFTLIAALVWGVSLMAVPAGAADDQQVTVTGQAEIVGNNKDAAQKKALSDAFRQAVEKGLGVWIKSETEVKNMAVAKDEILSKAEGYVTDHEIIKENVKDTLYQVTIQAKVSIDKIGVDFKKLVGRVKTQMGNPSITFVLTTWESKGKKGTSSSTSNVDVSEKERVKSTIEGGMETSSKSESNVSEKERVKSSIDMETSSKSESNVSASGRARASMDVSASGQGISGPGGYAGSVRGKSDVAYSGSAQSTEAYAGSVRGKSDVAYSGSAQSTKAYADSASVKGSLETSVAVDKSSKVAESSSYEKMDEKLWKKYPDATIIDSFQQEFKEKSFDLKAADKAREIAMTESLAKTSVDPSDRGAVRKQAEKEGANFVARGEAKILDSQKSDSTGNYDVTAQVGVEIIDVNSGDIVSSYSNTATASSKSEENARAQAIKKIATLGARKLADQTIATWQERALSGRQYTIEVRNITSMRKQKKPVMDAIESVAQITNQTSPENGLLVISVMYKGDKKKLGDDVLGQLGSKPGFSEKEFDGPDDEGGKIIFKFTK